MNSSAVKYACTGTLVADNQLLTLAINIASTTINQTTPNTPKARPSQKVGR